MKNLIIAVFALGLLSCEQETIEPEKPVVDLFTVVDENGNQIADTITIETTSLDQGYLYSMPVVVVESDSLLDNIMTHEEFWKDSRAFSQSKSIDQGEYHHIQTDDVRQYDAGQIILNIYFRDSLYLWRRPIKII